MLADKLNGARIVPGKHTRVEGLDQCDKVIHVDQNPIGRTPRSNPATYTGVWDKIRTLFAKTPEAQVRGYGPGRFSFNVKGGRCEACHGDGTLKIEMNFLPDVYVECEECHGKRYNRETLEVKYNGKTVATCLICRSRRPPRSSRLTRRSPATSTRSCRSDWGIFASGSPRPRCPAESRSASSSPPSCSAGPPARQCISSTNRPRACTSRTCANCCSCCRLVDKGNTVIVIEHNLDVVKSADWIIDLGPEGGDGGGTIVTQGTPEQVAQCEASWTGKFLKDML